MNNTNNIFLKNAHIPEYRGTEEKKKKFNFKKQKENVFTSLTEVEHFLCNSGQILKIKSLYKILKSRI